MEKMQVRLKHKLLKIIFVRNFLECRFKIIGEGVVEYRKKSFAMAAVRKCQERSFYITSALQPCIVEYYQFVTETDGCPEKFFKKKHPDFVNARAMGPRLAPFDTFEHDCGLRWKRMLEAFEEKQRIIKQELALEKDKLIAQLALERAELETEHLKHTLAQREMKGQKRESWEMLEQGGGGGEGGPGYYDDEEGYHQQDGPPYPHHGDMRMEAEERGDFGGRRHKTQMLQK